MRRSRIPVLLFLSVAIAACSGGEDAPAVDTGGGGDGGDAGGTVARTCQQLDEDFSLATPSLLEGLLECSTAADCALLEPLLECPVDARVSGCHVALADGRQGDFVAAVAARLGDLCAGAPSGCRSGPSCVAVEAACIAGACATRAQVGGADAVGGGADVPGSAIPCGEVRERFAELVRGAHPCKKAEECVLVGAPDSCDCVGALHGSGAAISRDKLTEATILEERFRSEACAAEREAVTVCDAAPAHNLLCDFGQCRASPAYCGVGPDGPEPLPLPEACVGELCAAGPNHAPDPSDWGPFPVGVKTIELTALGSVGQERKVVVEVWYPAVEEARDGPFEKIDLKAHAPPDLKETFAEVAVEPEEVQQVRDAELRRDDGPYPLALFSHGAFGIRFQSVFWTVYLASHGYVVASMDHAGNTTYDLLYDGGWSPEKIFDNALERPFDAAYTLEEMVRRNRAEVGFFHDSMDLGRVSISGHSFGGFTSFLLAFRDPRVKAVVAMAPHTVSLAIGNYHLPKLETPVMVMAGSDDNTLDPEVEMRRAYDRLPAPKRYFELKDGGHFTFSDICALDLESIAEQIDIHTDDALTDGCAPENIPADDAHRLIRQFGIGFLNYLMRDSPGSRAYFSPDAAVEHSEALLYLEELE